MHENNYKINLLARLIVPRLWAYWGAWGGMWGHVGVCGRHVGVCGGHGCLRRDRSRSDSTINVIFILIRNGLGVVANNIVAATADVELV